MASRPGHEDFPKSRAGEIRQNNPDANLPPPFLFI
jgi:hypothetical protein